MTRQSKEKEILEEFEKKFNNYVYVAELYTEAQMGDLNFNSLKSFIKSSLTAYAAFIEGEALAELKKQVEGMKYEISCDLPDVAKLCDRCEEGLIRNKALDDVLLSLNQKEDGANN